jgi:hypothetical protein
MPLMSPAAREFDVEEWLTMPQPERGRAMCKTWAFQGFGALGIAHVFYVVKLLLDVGGFLAFACATRGLRPGTVRLPRFEPGQLRCIVLESQPAGGPAMHRRIADAGTGLLSSRHIRVSDLLDFQPWGPS